MPTLNVKDGNNVDQLIQTLPPVGAAAAAASLPFTIATDDPLLSRLPASLGPKTGANSLSIVPASDATFVNAAGENHIGEVGSNELTIIQTPTISTSAYVSGYAVGGKLTFANAARVSGGSGLIQSVIVNCKSLQTAALDLVLFNANPSGTTFTDHAAWACNSGDFDKVIGVIHITDWTPLGTVISVAQAQAIAMAYQIAGTDLYGVLIARSTPTFASASDLKVQLTAIRN